MNYDSAKDALIESFVKACELELPADVKTTISRVNRSLSTSERSLLIEVNRQAAERGLDFRALIANAILYANPEAESSFVYDPRVLEILQEKYAREVAWINRRYLRDDPIRIEPSSAPGERLRDRRESPPRSVRTDRCVARPDRRPGAVRQATFQRRRAPGAREGETHDSDESDCRKGRCALGSSRSRGAPDTLDEPSVGRCPCQPPRRQHRIRRVGGGSHATAHHTLTAPASRSREASQSPAAPDLLELDLVKSGVVETFECFDFAEQRIAVGREQAAIAGLGDRVHYHASDAFRDVTAAGEFDFVHWQNAIHHMLDTREAIAWSSRCLAPGGVLYLDDYVGPSRFQYTNRQVRAFNHVLAALPARFLARPAPRGRLLFARVHASGRS